MHFDDILAIPVPIVSPMMAKITDPEDIDRVWAYFITPLKESYDAVNQTLKDNDQAPEQLPEEVRMLGAILRSMKAALDPEGSGWKELREKAAQAEIEFEKEQRGEEHEASIADKILNYTGDPDAVKEPSDPYFEGLHDAWQVAAGLDDSTGTDDGASD